MSIFEINILPFKILQEQIEISFSTEDKSKYGYNKIYKNNLPQNYPSEEKQKITKDAWWNTSSQADDITISVNLIENRRFAKNFFNKILFEYFYNQGLITNRNFINDTEIYLEDTSFSNNDCKKYNRFSLRIDNNNLIEGTSLLVSYDGDSYILKKSLAELNTLDPAIIGRIEYKNKITKYKDLTEAEKANFDKILPILNRKVEIALNINKPKRNYSENKYKKYYEHIHRFYINHLKGAVIHGYIKIYESGFYKPYDEKVGKASENSNLLLFGNNKTHFNPYIGLREYGPIEPPPINQIKFIFIFHEEDKAFANRLYSYLKKGYKSFAGLESFVKIQFNIDTSRSITFNEKNPFEQVKKKIEKLNFDKDSRYAALYISRIKKDTSDVEEEAVYFHLKELLLNYEITSQVIYKNNIDNPSFNYFLPNIAIALLAKLGGVPWRLSRPIKNDLVVGIGANRSEVGNNNFIGSTFCFRNDGKFKGFNAFKKNDTNLLAEAIREAIKEYINENQGFERLVIHFYKRMSYEEEKPIKEVLNNLDLNLPYVVVTVNDTESKDYVLFDTSFDGRMPQSGTFIRTKWDEYILCNNTRYAKNTGTRIDSFPLPIKIKFKSANYERIKDVIVVRELIDQVYQFSRMYWKSVRQRNMPVTIEYAEIVAEMIAHFDNKELGNFARNSLWFL